VRRSQRPATLSPGPPASLPRTPAPVRSLPKLLRTALSQSLACALPLTCWSRMSAPFLPFLFPPRATAAPEMTGEIAGIPSPLLPAAIPALLPLNLALVSPCPLPSRSRPPCLCSEQSTPPPRRGSVPPWAGRSAAAPPLQTKQSYTWLDQVTRIYNRMNNISQHISRKKIYQSEYECYLLH